MPDELLWRLTQEEVTALLEEIRAREEHEARAAALRAGAIAAMVYNVHRKKGAPALKASDFVRQPVRIVSPRELRSALSEWAKGSSE